MIESRINLRVKNILQRICGERDYVTISEIAKDLEVSGKTILRELPDVERWLKKRGCSLDRRAGSGIKVSGSQEARENIIRLLEEEKEEKIYTPRERQTVIISELLQNQEPVKLYNFTTILKVTESTISNDLDKVDKWFEKYGVKLIRKQGLGIYIEGAEDSIRKCMINLIYENIDETHLLGLIRSNISKSAVPIVNTELITRSRLLNLVHKDTINKLEALVHSAEEGIGYKLADSAYVGLIVHLAIAILRIRKNEDIHMDKGFIDELKESKEYHIAEKLAADMSQIFDIKVPEDEIGYITMHIKGSKNRNAEAKSSSKNVGNFELVRLSKEIIKMAEQETGRFVSNNEKLLVGLVNHLGPAISRLKMNLEIRNPLLEEIKIHYPDLLKVAAKCAAVIEKHIGIKMPESEVAYIAMHIGAAIENSEDVPKRMFRAAIACATGIGTSRLLATRIEKEYDNIKIVEVVSTLRIEDQWLKEKGVEFIISTVEIEECPIPVISVNPLLFEADKLKISKVMNKLKNTISRDYVKKKKTLKLHEKIRIVNSYGKAVTQVLNNFFLCSELQADNIEDIIHKVSSIIGKNNSAAEGVEAAIKAREEKGGTFITGHGILLLHCRTEAVSELYFGIVKTSTNIECINGRGEKEKLHIGVIMLAPEESDKYNIDTISYVSRMLIEREDFTKLLKNGSSEEAAEELSNILEEFYRLKCSKYLED